MTDAVAPSEGVTTTVTTVTTVTETAAHVERETLSVDVNIPEHDARVTTPLFVRTRKLLIEREKGRCFFCGCTEEESGHPLEAHHHPIERCVAGEMDWALVRRSIQVGDAPVWGRQLAALRAFDWSKFDPAHWEIFVDDMTVNGLLLCKSHHIGQDEGIHMLPWPLAIAQKYAVEGTKFNSREVIHHDQIRSDC